MKTGNTWLLLVGVVVLLAAAGLNYQRALLRRQLATDMRGEVQKFEASGITSADAVKMANIMRTIDRTNHISDSDLEWTLGLLHRPCLNRFAWVPAGAGTSVFMRTGPDLRLGGAQAIFFDISISIEAADLSAEQRGKIYPTCCWLMQSKDPFDRFDGYGLARTVGDPRMLPMLRQAVIRDPYNSARASALIALQNWGKKSRYDIGAVGPLNEARIKLRRALLGRPINSDSSGWFTQ
jgi:hypothetical protein